MGLKTFSILLIIIGLIFIIIGKYSEKSVTEYIYNKHTYLIFNNSSGGVVHDPDCKYCYDKFD